MEISKLEKWFLKNKKEDFTKIAQDNHISEVLARLLVNRGLTSQKEIQDFIHSNTDCMHDPHLLKDVDFACELLEEKINQNARIRIVGDYDVDGVVSTYLLYTALQRVGANVDYEIPERMKDGYGININIIKAAKEDQVDTIITCDNGIAAVEQVRYAKEENMTVIVTDHHDIPFVETENGREEVLPHADAVVNPKQQACSYPFPNICGAVVAYKLIEVLYERFGIEKVETKRLLAYAAIATVCDVMDLVDENRAIVKYGLELLKNTENQGLEALMELHQINTFRLSAYHLGFIIGPCLNASGRLETAKIGLELLLEKNREEARRKAVAIKELNDKRKDMTARGVEEAIEQIETTSLIKDKVLVVYLPECHESLAGIIAGRIRERYHKPAIVLTKALEGVKGSARSIEQYNMFEELTTCKQYLDKFGGHPMAAGLSLKEENIEPLRQALNETTQLTEEDLINKVSIDVLLPLGYVKEDLVEELELLEPFGKGNEKPVFAERNLVVKKADILGKNRNTLKLKVENQYGKCMDALYFNQIDHFNEYLSEKYGNNEVNKMYRGVPNSIRLSVVYYPNINEYNGMKTPQIIIQGIQ
ncbi:single-stranded-DNA-specific exonuclease RecJ [Anaerosporobacter faecicola]|uniref:single-stranded-DNA-specific exonuclease RecJ n=1 Tax=Anaerosporobacter faecicola TaxID=2718714 RepID=UPI001438C669|nr:single-stranded-DNA-specific exonuclease RecJ [Anaerosporobacter faecicola]